MHITYASRQSSPEVSDSLLRPPKLLFVAPYGIFFLLEHLNLVDHVVFPHSVLRKVEETRPCFLCLGLKIPLNLPGMFLGTFWAWTHSPPLPQAFVPDPFAAAAVAVDRSLPSPRSPRSSCK